MRSNSHKKHFRDNSDFMETPRTNRRSLREKQKLSQDIKAKYIQQLEQRNRKLKYEILKINEMLEQQKQKPQAKKQYKLIPNESSTEVLRNQLKNVYKQINNYEKQIKNLENKQAGGMITDKMSRLENILKQKSSHLDKLKNELSVMTKTSLDNSKKLKNNVGKQELENAMLKYNEQIKVLRQKVREAENKQKRKADNAKKQFDYIKKLQRQLIENGVAIDQIQDLKKNNIYNHIYDKMNNGDKVAESQVQVKNIKGKVEAKEEIEDMTVDRYAQLKNQINLYKKLQKDYDKRLQGLQKQRAVEQKQTNSLKDKLNEKQDEIRKLQDQIGQLKAKIKKVNIKPTTNISKPEPKVTKQKPKMSPTKLKQASNTKSITDQTHIKYDQKGQASKQGERFTDRNILGKGTDIKIIGVKVWTQKNTFMINGIQCIYKIGDKVKEGPQHINKDALKNCTQNVMQLSGGDYIKAISGHLSQGNIIQYLVFISKDSIIGRFGMAKQTQKQFNFDIDEDEIPICMYGSVSNTKEEKKQGSIIENLGFEICRDKQLNKDDKYI